MTVKRLTLKRQNKVIDIGSGGVYYIKGGDKMPTNQKYSTRVHSKRQLTRACDHVRNASLVLCELTPRYKDASPQVSEACSTLIEVLSMCENMITDIRDNI